MRAAGTEWNWNRDTDVTTVLKTSLKGLQTNSAIYAKPPGDLNAYENAINAFQASIPAARDGGKWPLRRRTHYFAR
jgi:hypothetical protein